MRDWCPATSPLALFFGDSCSEDNPNFIKNNINIKYLNYSAKKMHFGIDIAGGGHVLLLILTHEPNSGRVSRV